jgi:hypothetical protein
MRRQRKQTKKRSVKATVTGFILIKGVKSSESTKVRKSDVWGCLQRLCHTCLSAVRFRTLFWRFETSKLRFFEMPPDTLLYSFKNDTTNIWSFGVNHERCPNQYFISNVILKNANIHCPFGSMPSPTTIFNC